MKNYGQLDFCVLIPCYNNFEGLVVSVNTISYSSDKFLVLVVDDGSREPVDESMLRGKVPGNIPFVIIRNEKNKGITATLNSGLAWITENTDSRYIARLDCGDRCEPDRFVKQVMLMDQQPDIGLCGTWCKIIDKASSFHYSYTGPARHEEIVKAMYTRNVFMHATVMFRTSLLKTTGFYPTQFEYAEDYAFFWVLMNHSRTTIINEFLVTCELNKSGISYSNKGKQLFARYRVIRTFGKSIALKFAAYMRLLLLFMLPKRVTLLLKKWKG